MTAYRNKRDRLAELLVSACCQKQRDNFFFSAQGYTPIISYFSTRRNLFEQLSTEGSTTAVYTQLPTAGPFSMKFNIQHFTMPFVLPFDIIALIIDIVGENKDTNLL